MAKTRKNTVSGGYTTYGDDGKEYKTTQNVLNDGYTTRGSDGSTYRTTKDVISDGYTTFGDDGSTYKTHKDLISDGYTTYKTSGKKKTVSLDGVGGEIGGGIALFAVAVVVLQICANILSPMTYIYIAGVFIAPSLAGVCERIGISKVWCAGVLYCFGAFNLINSIFGDVKMVAGTKRGGEGLIVIIVLLMILIVGLFLVIPALDGTSVSFLCFTVIVVSSGWCFLNGISPIPHTDDVPLYATGIMTILALFDQSSVSSKKSK